MAPLFMEAPSRASLQLQFDSAAMVGKISCINPLARDELFRGFVEALAEFLAGGSCHLWGMFKPCLARAVISCYSNGNRAVYQTLA